MDVAELFPRTVRDSGLEIVVALLPEMAGGPLQPVSGLSVVQVPQQRLHHPTAQ